MLSSDGRDMTACSEQRASVVYVSEQRASVVHVCISVAIETNMRA